MICTSGRVSSSQQRDYLARQVEFMAQQHPGDEIIQDLGSRLKFKKGKDCNPYWSDLSEAIGSQLLLPLATD